MNQGIYEQLISEELSQNLESLKDSIHIEKSKVDFEEAARIFSKYMSDVIEHALKLIRQEKAAVKDPKQNAIKLLKQVSLCNDIISQLDQTLVGDDLLAYKINQNSEVLLSIQDKLNSIQSANKSAKLVRPETSIAESSLFTGAVIEPNMMSEMKKEILSCDRMDMLVSFIRWSGLRQIIEEIKVFLNRSDDHKVRVITTSYIGATEYKAIEELSKLKNVEIKISYDTKRTRLHAKAYLFHRKTGFTTAYIGSSNLSYSAMTSGLEWNIKVSEKESLPILQKFRATFNSYWNDEEFEAFCYGDESSSERLREALNRDSRKADTDQVLSFVDVHPYYFQTKILNEIEAEREVFGKHNNLVVAATGVGKTMISAFDFKRLYLENKGHYRLLFVAHREEILKQSLYTFRAVLRDNNFGDLFVGGHVPDSLDHLFVSIQTFNSQKMWTYTSAENYDYIVVDEFHHAAASSYVRLLDYYKPKELLGLTATPERMDGQNVLGYFDGRITSELRLGEAINNKLLAPFQYFCISDTVDLAHLKWRRGGYDTRELSRVYTSNERRSGEIVKALHRYVNDVEEVKALAFCVSVDHAEYMATYFSKAGIASMNLDSSTNKDKRNSAKAKLTSGDIKILCVVDLFNEGVDIPAVNTVLFLRPTESLTVFLQQLGRGLRLHEHKECLTVLDFIGQAHKNYDFEQKFKAIMTSNRHSVKHMIEKDTYFLPKGCFLQLEKQAKAYVLRSVKNLTMNKTRIVKQMTYFEQETQKPLVIKEFCEHYHLELPELYGKQGKYSFYGLKHEAGVSDSYVKPDVALIRKLKNVFHLNSRQLIQYMLAYLRGEVYEYNKYYHNVFYYTFYSGIPVNSGLNSIDEGLQKIKNEVDLKEELIELLMYRYSKIDFVDKHEDLGVPHGLDMHCNYTRDQLLAGLGEYNEDKCPTLREGVKYLKSRKTDVFLITLNKSDKDFSMSTMYEDYAINNRLFHWQSQNATSDTSPTGMRYINHKERGTKVLLFVRGYKETNGLTSPFTYLGEAEYVSHEGNKPISFVWRLKESMPARVMPVANKTVI